MVLILASGIAFFDVASTIFHDNSSHCLICLLSLDPKESNDELMLHQEVAHICFEMKFACINHVFMIHVLHLLSHVLSWSLYTMKYINFKHVSKYFMHGYHSWYMCVLTHTLASISPKM